MARVPPSAQFRDVLMELAEILHREEGVETNRFKRIGGVVEVLLPDSKPIVVVGDTHGDYDTFLRILKIIDESSALEEGLVVFLGDYIDRGMPEEQILLLHDLASLKREKRDNLILLRGNHEPFPGLIPHPHDYPWALKEVYGYEEGESLYNLSRKVFDLMPHAVVLKERALLVHGGPPTSIESHDIYEYLAYDRRPEILEEILWNDPIEQLEFRAPNPRGAGYLWGRIITEKSLAITQAKIIIRGHEPAPNGYKFNHKDRVLTLFSRLGPPYYNEKAAIVACSIGDLVDKIRDCIKLIGYTRVKEQ